MAIYQEESKLNFEIFIKQNRLLISYKFKYDIETLYNFFIQPSHFKEIYNEFINEFICIEGSPTLNSKGSEFIMVWKENISSKLRIQNVIETPAFKLINLYHYSIASTEFKLNTIYKFYKSTIEPGTHYSYEAVFESPQALSFHQIQFSSYDYTKVFNNFCKYVQKSTSITEHVESVVIDADLDDLWEVLEDWGKFQELAPTIADKIEYEFSNAEDKEYTHIKLMFDNCNIVHVLKLITRFKGNDSALFVVSLLNSNMKSLSQDLEFSLQSLKDGQCLLIFKHIFRQKQVIDNTFLDQLSKSKRKILTSLRDGFSMKAKSVYNSCGDSSTVDEVNEF
jgi:hypothetical protein